MSNTPKQSPLGINTLGSLLTNTGFTINPSMTSYIGTSKDNNSYAPGSIIKNTCLNLLTYAINDAYVRGAASGNSTVSTSTYNNLISIGATTIPGLGNSVPPSYEIADPSNQWNGEATTGYALAGTTGQGQSATWLPYDTTNPNVSVTQWGYLRLLVLQAWNAFNWNGVTVNATTPEYQDFCNSFNQADGFLKYYNQTINAAEASKTFLQGTYSNMNDLISADITGVNLATQAFGQDLMNLGKALNISKISTFGLPSNLLQTLRQNNGINQDLSLAIIASGLSQSEYDRISSGGTATKEQEQKLYGAFLIIRGDSLQQILIPLLVKTKNIVSLADLLNIKKLFPTSYQSMTVPLYNTSPGPTNAKTYYLIYKDETVNTQLTQPAVIEQVGTQVLSGTPLFADNTSIDLSGIEIKDEVTSVSIVERLIKEIGVGSSKSSGGK